MVTHVNEGGGGGRAECLLKFCLLSLVSLRYCLWSSHGTLSRRELKGTIHCSCHRPVPECAPKSFARTASPREYPSFTRILLVPHTGNTIAFCICIYILTTFPPNKIKALGPGYARQFTWSTENKTLSLSPSFLLASLLLNIGDFPWSQNNCVSGSGLPVYSLPHWSGTRGEERRLKRNQDRLYHGISASLFPQPLQKMGQVSNQN